MRAAGAAFPIIGQAAEMLVFHPFQIGPLVLACEQGHEPVVEADHSGLRTLRSNVLDQMEERERRQVCHHKAAADVERDALIFDRLAKAEGELRGLLQFGEDAAQVL